MKGISEILIGAKAPGYGNLRWVQTVTRSDFGKNNFQMILDGDGPGHEPFYWSDDTAIRKNSDQYGFIFQDMPGIYVNEPQNFLWTAELSLVGTINGNMERIFTLTYGFRINGTEAYYFQPRAQNSPSSYHMSKIPVQNPNGISKKMSQYWDTKGYVSLEPLRKNTDASIDTRRN